MSDRSFLVLGGAGLVGYQIAHRIAADLDPETVVVTSLYDDEVNEAAARLRRAAPGVEIVGEWGDVFVRTDFTHRSRPDLMADPEARRAVFQDLLGPIDDAYRRSRLAELILRHRPDVVVDTVTTATAISYQDLAAAAVIAERDVEALLGGERIDADVMAHHVEELILSVSMPQLIRHVTILHRALVEAGTRLYLKVGTSGTGGMGLDIPFTHSEDRPSAKLLTKAAVGFAHTGLLFLMARTGDLPVVKEVKPSTLIGYADVAHSAIVQRGRPVGIYRARRQPLAETLALRLEPGDFEGPRELRLPVINTGENGVFTKGEFDAITSLGMMEMVTPEEIAHLCVREIQGANTGRDVIAALDASVLGPSYRAGVLRSHVMERVEALEESTGTHSVALGQLGPPELSKLLWEAELLRLVYGTIDGALAADAATIAKEMRILLDERTDLADTITSLGLPVLCADGTTLMRGPFLRIPEIPGETEVECSTAERDRWAAKGWVDLRAENWASWQERFRAMCASRAGRDEPGSAGYRPETSLGDRIEIGAVTAWVLAEEVGGRRVK